MILLINALQFEDYEVMVPFQALSMVVECQPQRQKYIPTET
jgi:hypothetical protein